MEIKQLYSGEQKTPFYPKVKLPAIETDGGTTLEQTLNNIANDIKQVWKTVYGVNYPNTNNTSAPIDSVPEVYEALQNGTGGGSKVSIYNTYNDGGCIATIKIDNVPKDIKVPESIISELILNTNGKWGLEYNEDSGTLRLLYDDTVIASTNLLGNSDEPVEYLKPATPSGLRATYSASTNSITLVWNPVKENISGSQIDEYVGNYEIIRRINGAEEEEYIIVPNGETTTWTDTRITDGTYEYKIRARSHATTYISNWSGFTSAITVSSGQEDQDDTINRSVSIVFPNDEAEVPDIIAQGEYTNIMRRLSNQETQTNEVYQGQVNVFGSSAFLNQANYVKVTDFYGVDHIVRLGTKQVSGNGYVKSGDITITRAYNNPAPSSTPIVIELKVLASENSTSYLLSGRKTYHFVYPIYTGYVNANAWDIAISENDSSWEDTVILHGNMLTDNDNDRLGWLDNGYVINNYLFNCQLTQSQKNNSELNQIYAQIAIPLNQSYAGRGITTDESNMPSRFESTTINGQMIEMQEKQTVHFGGITYWIYTAAVPAVKNKVINNGTTLKAKVQ